MLYHNIEGLRSHLEDLKITLGNRIIDFICLVEICVTNEITPNTELNLFSSVHQLRRYAYTSGNAIQTQGKGVVCVHRKLKRHERVILLFDNIEYIAFKATNLLFITLYIPSSCAVEFCFSKTMNKMIEMEPPCLIIGDFNQNINTDISSIKQLIEKNGYTQLVTEVTTDCGTMIDHVYVCKYNNARILMIPIY